MKELAVEVPGLPARHDPMGIANGETPKQYRLEAVAANVCLAWRLS